jgi:hypothetical protein
MPLALYHNHSVFKQLAHIALEYDFSLLRLDSLLYPQYEMPIIETVSRDIHSFPFQRCGNLLLEIAF